MQGEAVWRIPDPDYDRHPGYRRQFGAPTLGLRLKALGRVLPYLCAYAAWDVVSRCRRRAVATGAGQPSATFEALQRDGVVALRFTEDERTQIRTGLAPQIAALRAKRAGLQEEPPARPDQPRQSVLESIRRNGVLGALHKRLNPRPTPNMWFVLEEDAPEVFQTLRQALDRHGALEAASRYQGRKLDVRLLKLVINGAGERWWGAPFADLDMPEPPALTMHVDHLWTTKAILYVSEVGERNGPFCYCLGSNHVRIGWLEGAARRANDRVDFSSCEAEQRRMFNALPAALRHKAKFGNDLQPDDPALARLLAAEKRFTSADGDLLLFDDRGIHRGGLVEEGDRCILQIRLA
jgi:hypothetical protein